MRQKSTTFTTIYRVKKCFFHYNFSCKKVPLSLQYTKKKYCFIVSKSFDHLCDSSFTTRKINLIKKLVKPYETLR
jgi:hypothetical protein